VTFLEVIGKDRNAAFGGGVGHGSFKSSFLFPMLLLLLCEFRLD
jgi:hypothetical protein